MSQKDVLFVVLNFNGWRETLACVNSLLEQTYSSFHILLIDNGSVDESLKKLKVFEDHPKITFIKNPVNAGFAGGVNIGINYAINHNYIYTSLINNDATLAKDWVKILIKTIKSKNVDVATGLLLDSTGDNIESTADSYSIWGMPFPNQRGEKVDSATNSRYVFGGTAGASVYKTSLFEDIGLFDDVFFAYFEDSDISFRAQLAGHRAYYEKKAIAYHDHGTTSSKIPGFTVRQTFKNLPLLFWKNIPAGLLPSMLPRFLMYYIAIYLRSAIRGQFIIASKGVVLSIRHLPHALQLRRSIQADRKVPLSYLRSIIYPSMPPNNRDTLRRILRRQRRAG